MEENRNLTLQTSNEDNQKLSPETIEEKPQVTYYSLVGKTKLISFFSSYLNQTVQIFF